jgi:hypothetical protein
MEWVGPDEREEPGDLITHYQVRHRQVRYTRSRLSVPHIVVGALLSVAPKSIGNSGFPFGAEVTAR